MISSVAYVYKDNGHIDESPVKISIEEPSICGYCNRTGEQKILYSLIAGQQFNRFAGVALTFCFFCKGITVRFLVRWPTSDTFLVYQSEPSGDNPKNELSDYIKKEYPDFSEIYNQSQIAEKEKLDKIAGVGYRKALEFLISDYLLNVQGENSEWINNPSTTLANKIGKIEDEKLQTVAKAGSWVGNDQTHYSPRHPELGIEDLKAFITATLSTIENYHQIDNAKKIIDNKK